MHGARVGWSLRQVLDDSIDKAVRIQHSVVANHVQRVRRRRPGAEPAEIIAALEKHYLATLTSIGAAVGAAAAVPGVGAVVALALIATDAAAFLEATALFTLAVASVRGVPVDSVERRRMLLLAVLLGSGETALADQTSTRLRRWLITKYRAQRWILAISKILPFGIGAAIGAAGNRAYGRTVVATTRQMFDPAPQTVTPAAVPAPVALPNSRPPAATVGQVTGKYQPLFDRLAACDADHVEISFFEIDQMVTGGLPKSASGQRGWWANSPGRVQAKAWLAAGFQIAHVNLAATTVRFERGGMNAADR